MGLQHQNLSLSLSSPSSISCTSAVVLVVDVCLELLWNQLLCTQQALGYPNKLVCILVFCLHDSVDVFMQLVAGSVVMAFETVCPERIDLIHKNYRKLCNLLVDVDEWGQVMILQMLTRYVRSQFLDPNQQVVLNFSHPIYCL